MDQLARVGYDTLGLSTFLTAGEKEFAHGRSTRLYRAAGSPALIIRTSKKASSSRHRLLRRFRGCRSSMVKIKEEGKLRQEGRDYVMQDGDIVEFKFNVSK